MYLEIVTPERKVFEGEVDSAKFPGSQGEFQVLNDHAPIISSLNKGIVFYKDKKGQNEVEVGGGVVEVLNNRIVVLAESVAA
ncbi:MAG: ATP synthase F1 subunit epsilon [Bacteroidota bacterium]